MRATTYLLAALVAAPLVAHAGFGASSYKKDSRTTGASRNGPDAGIDGDPATAWMVDPEEKNVGQWIEIDVPKGKVDKLSLVVGWAQDDDTWSDHARLKEARIEVFTVEGLDAKMVFEQVVTLEDKKDRQFVDLPDPVVGDEFSGGKVRLTVTDVYPGKDFEHLALGEVLVHMVEFDAAIVNIATPPTSEVDGHDGAMLVDDSTRTYWAATSREDAMFSVEGGRYSVSSIGIYPGPVGRPKVIEVTQSNVTKRYDVPDKAAWHWFELPALVGYTGSAIGPVTVKVVEIHGDAPGTSIAEVKFRATMLEAF